MNQELSFYYQQFTDLWKTLCSAQNELYQITCEEYLALLNSDIARVNKLISLKEEIIKHIDIIEEDRKLLVQQIAQSQGLEVNALLKFKTIYRILSDALNLDENNTLLKYHTLIVELIEKTQEQNKKNRLFLNKALASIQEIKKELTGNVKVANYSRTGEKQDHCR